MKEIENDSVDGQLVAILGASGFVGNAVLGELARHPVQVRAVSRSAVQLPPPGLAAITVRRSDLLVSGEVSAAIEGADTIVHLVTHATAGSTWRSATSDPDATRVNLHLVHEVLAALRARRPAAPPLLLYASTAQAAHGAESSPYAQQKLAAEECLRQATANGLLRAVILRLPTIFGRRGPESPAGRGVIAAMIQRALAGECLTMWHDGRVRRNVLHLDDVAAAFSAALRHHGRLSGGCWDVGADRSVPLGDIFAMISGAVARQTGKPAVPVVSVAPPENAEANDFRSDDVDSVNFRTRSGWRPVMPLPKGIERTVTATIKAGGR